MSEEKYPRIFSHRMEAIIYSSSRLFFFYYNQNGYVKSENKFSPEVYFWQETWMQSAGTSTRSDARMNMSLLTKRLLTWSIKSLSVLGHILGCTYARAWLPLGWGGGVGFIPWNRLLGMYRWMGPHFHDWIDYNRVTFSFELLEIRLAFSGFWG